MLDSSYYYETVFRSPSFTFYFLLHQGTKQASLGCKKWMWQVRVGKECCMNAFKGRITKNVNIKAVSECSCYFGEGDKRGERLCQPAGCIRIRCSCGIWRWFCKCTKCWILSFKNSAVFCTHASSLIIPKARREKETPQITQPRRAMFILLKIRKWKGMGFVTITGTSYWLKTEGRSYIYVVSFCLA